MTDRTRTFRINAGAALMLDQECKETGEPRPAMVLASLLREALAIIENPFEGAKKPDGYRDPRSSSHERRQAPRRSHGRWRAPRPDPQL